MFESNNPEVNLPSNLEVQILVEDFSPLGEGCDNCLKEGVDVDIMTQVDGIASKSCVNNSDIVKNDRSILEC